MKMHKLILLALACSWSVGALAQWQWIDKDGRKVFSDRPPPQDVPDSKILKQPRFTPSAPVPPAAAASTNAAPAAAPATSAAGSGKDKELEKKKAQAEANEAAKQKAAEAKQAAARADNCTRAKEAKALFESGKPVRKPDAQGELVFLDEAGRAAEMRRIQSIIDADCKR
jgi:hypothetical protein